MPLCPVRTHSTEFLRSLSFPLSPVGGPAQRLWPRLLCGPGVLCGLVTLALLLQMWKASAGHTVALTQDAGAADDWETDPDFVVGSACHAALPPGFLVSRVGLLAWGSPLFLCRMTSVRRSSDGGPRLCRARDTRSTSSKPLCGQAGASCVLAGPPAGLCARGARPVSLSAGVRVCRTVWAPILVTVLVFFVVTKYLRNDLKETRLLLARVSGRAAHRAAAGRAGGRGQLVAPGSSPGPSTARFLPAVSTSSLQSPQPWALAGRGPEPL